MDNKKSVCFGTKQEAIITPKEGYEVTEVAVVNTADNSVIPSELRQDEHIPTQWICSFVQPAAHVIIKPAICPIQYSVSFEISDAFTVVLVEHDSPADIEIKMAADQQNNNSDIQAEQESNSQESDFSEPQHSVNDGANEALDVGDKDAKNLSASPDTEAESESSTGEYIADGEATVQEPEGNSDVAYDAGEFADELEDFEPVVITQQQYNEKNNLFWSWKTEFDYGRCSEEKFANIQKKHQQWLEDISAGKIVVEG